MRVAVAGAGITGRLAALVLQRGGHAVTLFDSSAANATRAPSHVAAGMLAPLSESAYLAPDERWLYRLGWDSLKQWQDLAATLAAPVTINSAGTIVAARGGDEAETQEFETRLKRVDADAEVLPLDRDQLARLEPALGEAHFSGLLVRGLGGEGAINPAEAMAAIFAAFLAEGGRCRWQTPVEQVSPKLIVVSENRKKIFFDCDLVIDARGLGARSDLGDLRGVRGELLHLNAPDVDISRVTRISHGRHPIYIVPRGNGRYVVGATSVESESEAPVSVTSALELLTTVYSVHPGFRHAAISQFAAGVRPAFFDNAPRIQFQAGIARVNGLYRHGYLLGPAVAAELLKKISKPHETSSFPELFAAEGGL